MGVEKQRGKYMKQGVLDMIDWMKCKEEELMLVTMTTFNKEMDVGKELKENLSGKRD